MAQKHFSRMSRKSSTNSNFLGIVAERGGVCVCVSESESESDRTGSGSVGDEHRKDAINKDCVRINEHKLYSDLPTLAFHE
jgi:hypothetical protein